jgi:hypothetical protein
MPHPPGHRTTDDGTIKVFLTVYPAELTIYETVFDAALLKNKL